MLRDLILDENNKFKMFLNKNFLKVRLIKFKIGFRGSHTKVSAHIGKWKYITNNINIDIFIC